MADLIKFQLALDKYYKVTKESSEKKYLIFQKEIKNLNCYDYRLYILRAAYYNKKNKMSNAQSDIDQAIFLTKNSSYTIEEIKELNLPITYLGPAHQDLYNIYSCAGEIYAKIKDEEKSLTYYKISRYYNSFLKSGFNGTDKVTVFSFRRFNEYSLCDLINKTITVSPSTKMNDPLDSLINIWGNENRLRTECKEQQHVRPMSLSFNYYRIRSFCMGRGNTSIRNILMWSHYAGEHNGFCIKYKLSKHFIKQDENTDYEHMYLKKILYTNRPISILSNSIDSDLAFATKKSDWKYEHEVRLIVYNPNKECPFYGINLDESSEIDSIFFGYRCSETTIKTVRNIFSQRKSPNFFKMEINAKNIYKLNYKRI